MSKDDPEKSKELDPDLAGAIERIAASRAPEQVVSRLVVASSSLGSPDIHKETPMPLHRNGYPKEEYMSNSINKISIWKWTTIGTTAAGVALVLGLMFFTNQASAFAKMQKAMLRFETLQFSSEFFQPGSKEAWRSSKTYLKGDFLYRDEVAAPELGDPIDIFDFSTGRYAKFSTSLKRAAIGSISEEMQKEFMQISDEFIEVLTNADAEAADEIDRYVEDGRTFIKYEYEARVGPGTVLVNVVVDTADFLPVEIKFVGPDGTIDRKTTDIVFDAPLDDSLFSTEAPDGYDVIEKDIE